MNNLNKSQKSTLLFCGSAHFVHDGLMALQFVLLPLLAQALGLSYTQVGILRSCSHVAMSSLEIPAGFMAERFGEKKLLIAGLTGISVGYLGVSQAGEFFTLALFFSIAGTGAAFQHSLASSLLVGHFDGASRRRALGTYNALGDAGKLAYTAVFSLSVGVGLALDLPLAGLALSAAILALLTLIWFRPQLRVLAADPAHGDTKTASVVAPRQLGVLDRPRFTVLGLAVYLDSVIQSVFFTFLVFILVDKGLSAVFAAFAVTLALSGGMVGKFCCGFLAARFGDRCVFAGIQLLTGAGILALIYLPPMAVMLLLPLIGLVVQGSTTISYGAAADFLHPQRQSRGYSVIYTLSAVATVTGPVTFGWIADSHSLELALAVLLVLVLMTVPMCFVLGSHMAEPAKATANLSDGAAGKATDSPINPDNNPARKA